MEMKNIQDEMYRNLLWSRIHNEGETNSLLTHIDFIMYCDVAPE